MNVKTMRIFEPNDAVMLYLQRCSDRGFGNNSDLVTMKWQWCMDNGGAWYASFKPDGSIVSMSGIHPFDDGYRALFRGAQLESRPVGINKYHMQSYCFHSQLPYQIAFAKRIKPIYITTNVYRDVSGKMKRMDDAFRIFDKLGLVSFVEQRDIFNAVQNIWRLNVDRYTDIRRRW